MKTIIALALTLIASTANATIWLNIPGHYDWDKMQEVPSQSIPTPDHEACSDAVAAYAKLAFVYYIGCDINPLPDAVNIKRK